MSDIQWFPGHMTKSFRSVEENIKNIDVVLCVLDARAPYSCRNFEVEKVLKNKKLIFIINKKDMANIIITDKWVDYFKALGFPCIAIDATSGRSKNLVFALIKSSLVNKIIKESTKAIKTKHRIAVVGVPNTGKSTLLNTLIGSSHAKTGNKAGITRTSSWIKCGEDYMIMDNAGTLYPKFANQKIAQNLAFIGSINDEILDLNEIAFLLIEKLKEVAPKDLMNRYNLQSLENDTLTIFEEICKNRSFILKKGEFDYDRASKAIIDDFRKNRIGKISLESPEIFEQKNDYGTN